MSGTSHLGSAIHGDKCMNTDTITVVVDDHEAASGVIEA
jgi:hypothetical protein